jgi:hypothetical protein
MSIEIRSMPPSRGVMMSEQSLLDDWLGFAHFLASAVARGDATEGEARSELATAACSFRERRALQRAADIAAREHGAASITAQLLRASYADVVPSAEVA